MPKTVPPLRSVVLKVRLRSRFGSRQTKEKTSEMTPATRRQKSKNDHAAIRRLDNISLRGRMTKSRIRRVLYRVALPESAMRLEPARDPSRNRTKDGQRHRNCPAAGYIAQADCAVA